MANRKVYVKFPGGAEPTWSALASCANAWPKRGPAEAILPGSTRQFR